MEHVASDDTSLAGRIDTDADVARAVSRRGLQADRGSRPMIVGHLVHESRRRHRIEGVGEELAVTLHVKMTRRIGELAFGDQVAGLLEGRRPQILRLIGPPSQLVRVKMGDEDDVDRLGRIAQILHLAQTGVVQVAEQRIRAHLAVPATPVDENPGVTVVEHEPCTLTEIKPWAET
jgi:hypothetical protein